MAKKMTNEEFLLKAAKKHDLSEYDWSDFDVQDRDEKGRVVFNCKKHGKYYDWPNNFLKGHGCHICHGKGKSDDEVKAVLSKLHPDLDFSEANYSEKDSKRRLKVICPKHGAQMINYNNLLNGQGCYHCGREKAALKNTRTTETLIQEAEIIHGKGKYSYELVDMASRDEQGKIIVTCPKHGNFKITPDNLLHGHGCPICKHSTMEDDILRFLSENGIESMPQYRSDWLGKLSLDFFLPNENIAIECQGLQHFKPIQFFGGEANFKKMQERDALKKSLCEQNEVNLLYYADYDYAFPYDVVTSKEELLKKIRLSR